MKQPYPPQNLPLKFVDWARFVSLIGQANAEIARYDGILQGINNPGILLSPLTTREAVLYRDLEVKPAFLKLITSKRRRPA